MHAHSLAPQVRPDRRVSRPRTAASFLMSLLLMLLAIGAAQAQDVIINEFMASNDSGLTDEDGDTSDWIELRNVGSSAISLSGWHLTDDAEDLNKWQFPAGMSDLPAGGYLVVFASDKNRRVAGSELHTNFKLSAGGEYLALVRPDGITVEHAFDPEFPDQQEDVSYGLGSEGIEMTLVDANAACEVIVPASDTFSPFSSWLTSPSTGWTTGTYAVGYDNSSDYLPYIDDTLEQPLHDQMYGVNTTILSRASFTVANPAALQSLTLRMRYDDGFVAYLNGVRVCDSGNAPSTLTWNSEATAGHSDRLAVEWVDYNLSAFIGQLSAGTNVLAIHGLNDGSTSSDMLIQPMLVAYADSGTALDYRYFETPTPGSANASGKLGYVEPVEADYDHGYYTAGFSLTLSCDTEGATIRYTTNCDEPSRTTGTIYTGPIAISQSTVVRAMAYKSGYDDSPSTTFTYIFPGEVINQPNDQSARGFPTTWYAGATSSGAYDRRTRTADYAMDPQITQDPLYAPEMIDALYDLPVMSLVTTMFDMFDSNSGMYPNSMMRAGSNIFWEKSCSLELFDPAGEGEDFTVNAGARITGELARWPAVNDKQSFRVVFRSDYGASKLETDFFDDPEVDKYDTIVVRSHWGQSFLNDEVRGDEIGVSFANGDPTRTTYIRDIYGHDSYGAAGQFSVRGRFVHLYLNGIYWGLYCILERPDDSFNAEHLGGEKEEYDVIKGGVGQTTTNGYLQSGERDAYNKLFTYFNATSSGSNTTTVTPTSDATLALVEQYLDVDAFIDYMATLWHMCRLDFPRKNWYCVARRNPSNSAGVPLERFRYYTWDSEASLWAPDSSEQADRWNASDTSNDTGPVRIYRRLRLNASFQRRWGDRVQDLYFNDGPFTPQASIDRFHARRMEIDKAVICESARWGDWAELHNSNPLTRNNEWTTECDRLETEYFTTRREIVLDQMAAVNLWPGFYAPVFAQHGGAVADGYTLAMTNPNASGSIYYTLDGSDPRDAASPTLYTGPVSLGEAGFVEVKACVRIGSDWSALNHAGFVTYAPGGLVVSEIMYNPPVGGDAGGSYAADAYEYIELLNNTAGAIDLSGMSISGDVQYTFPASTVLAGGARVLVASDISAMIQRYGSLGYTPHIFTGDLGNGDGEVTLKAPDGTVLYSVFYEDGGNWPGRADGKGSSLELVEPIVPPSEPGNWRNSAEYLGSPSLPGAGALRDVVVNEVLSHTDPPEYDYIELHNRTAAAVDVSGWFLSDADSQYTKFEIPAGTVIPAGGYVVFDENDFNTGAAGSFALNSAHGDDVWLMEAYEGKLIRFVDHAEFSAAANGEAFGLWPNGQPDGRLYPLSYPTPELANAEPRIGEVVISEIAYNMNDDEDLEFVELFNASSQAIDLTGWELAGGVDYAFEDGEQLAAGSTLIVISFNPYKAENAARLTTFENYYALADTVKVLGGYGGNLSNAGERITLYRPDEPPMEEPYFTPLLTEDTVRFRDNAPWPTSPDDGGDTLHRVLPAGWADDAANWTAALPTPGAVANAPHPGDANGDGKVNVEDFIILKQNYNTVSGATFAEGDFDGDGAVNVQDFIILKQNYNYGMSY